MPQVELQSDSGVSCYDVLTLFADYNRSPWPVLLSVCSSLLLPVFSDAESALMFLQLLLHLPCLLNSSRYNLSCYSYICLAVQIQAYVAAGPAEQWRLDGIVWQSQG